ncbi:MAG: alpha/beta fold hydrolase [Nocardioidaceae bacterium]
MPWFGPDGQRIYYEDHGRGETVLVLPGWAGSIAEIRHLRAALEDGFRVIAADLPGSGRSQPQPRQYDASFYRQDARSMLGLLDELGVGSAHLVGFSDGGEDALVMAALEPSRVRSVLTWGAAGHVQSVPGMLEGAHPSAGRSGRASPAVGGVPRGGVRRRECRSDVCQLGHRVTGDLRLRW